MEPEYHPAFSIAQDGRTGVILTSPPSTRRPPRMGFFAQGVMVMKMLSIVCLLAVGLVFSPALPCAQTETGTLPQKTGP